jgi:hypothetical protein
MNNDVVKRLDSLEQKLRVHSQTVYKLADCMSSSSSIITIAISFSDGFLPKWFKIDISTHRRESDYEGVSREVNELTKDINTWAQAQVNAK